MVRLVSLGVLLTLIVVLGTVFFKVVAPFILPLFLAGVAAMLCQPAYGSLVAKVKGRSRLAAGLLTSGVMLVILVPVVMLITIVSLRLFASGSTMQVSRVERQASKVVETLLDKSAEVLVGLQDSRWLPEGMRLRIDPKEFEQLVEGDITRIDDIDLGRDDSLMDRADDESDQVFGEDDAADDDRESDDEELAMDDTDDGVLVPAEASNPVEAFDALPRERKIALVKNELRVQGKLALSELGDRSLGTAGKWVGGTLGVVTDGLGAALGAILALAMFGIGLYYFLADGPQMIRSVQKLVPVQVAYQQELLGQFSSVVRSVVTATFAAALVQAVMCTAALALCGIPHLIVLFVLAFIGSMIPLAGTWLVWAPAAVYLFIEGHYISGILLTIWGAGVIGVADNVVRTYVLGAQTKLHPLLAFVSVLGGLQVMGLWGIFVGPIVASCLHALIEIFNQELAELSEETFAKTLPAEPAAKLDAT